MVRKWYRDLRRTLPPTDAKLRRKFFEEKVGADPELSGSGPAPASAPAGQVARWPGGVSDAGFAAGLPRGRRRRDPRAARAERLPGPRGTCSPTSLRFDLEMQETRTRLSSQQLSLATL